MSARSIFDWRGQPSASGADLMRGRVAPNKTHGPLNTTGKNLTTNINTEPVRIVRTKGASI